MSDDNLYACPNLAKAFTLFLCNVYLRDSKSTAELLIHNEGAILYSFVSSCTKIFFSLNLKTKASKLMKNVFEKFCVKITTFEWSRQLLGDPDRDLIMEGILPCFRYFLYYCEVLDLIIQN